MPQNLRRAGVMGWPINHSLSPKLHRFWLKMYGLKGDYRAYAVRPEELPSALKNLKDNGLCGVNLTIPHKEAARTLVDTMSKEARRIGAINLVFFDDRNRLFGHNTDAFGFSQNLLSSGFKPQQKLALVLGAGGACRAVVVALQDMGFTDIVLSNRTLARAHTVAQALSTPACPIRVIDWDNAPDAMDGVDLLVNATALGMTGQPALTLDLQPLPKTATVTDVVYTPLETPLLRAAKECGLKTVDGLGMLLHQARPSFKAFFGHDPEVTQALRDAVLTVGGP